MVSGKYSLFELWTLWVIHILGVPCLGSPSRPFGHCVDDRGPSWTRQSSGHCQALAEEAVNFGRGSRYHTIDELGLKNHIWYRLAARPPKLYPKQ